MPWSILLPSALYRFFQEIRLGNSGKEMMLLIIWPAMVLAVFTLSQTRIEYYSLPALPALGLILGWRVERWLASPKDRSLLLALLVLALMILAGTFSLQFLEELCAGNRREFVGIFPLVHSFAPQGKVTLALMVCLGFLGGWRRRYLVLIGYGLVALASLFFAFQVLTALGPVRSDKLAGEYVQRYAAPGDLLVMESFEEAEMGASLAFYAGRPFLMVQRHGLPRFRYRIDPQENYLISPARLKELWDGPRRVFLLVDDAMPLEPYLKDAQAVQAGGGKRLLVNRPLGNS